MFNNVTRGLDKMYKSEMESSWGSHPVLMFQLFLVYVSCILVLQFARLSHGAQVGNVLERQHRSNGVDDGDGSGVDHGYSRARGWAGRAASASCGYDSDEAD